MLVLSAIHLILLVKISWTNFEVKVGHTHKELETWKMNYFQGKNEHETPFEFSYYNI